MIRPLSLLLAVLLAGSLGFAPVAEAVNPVGGILQNAVTANGNGQTLSVGGIFLIATYTVSGTFSATVNFEGQAADSSFQSIGCVPVTGGAAVSSTTTTGAWRCNITGFVQIRGRISGYASGSVTVGAQAADSGSTMIGPPSDLGNCGDATLTGVIIITCPPYNAIGDNSTDIQPAIAAAYAALPTGGGKIVFPLGTFRAASKLAFNTSQKPVSLIGTKGNGTSSTFGTTIIGSFADNLIETNKTPMTIEDMSVENDDPAGTAIRLNNVPQSMLKNLRIRAGLYGVWASSASLMVGINLKFDGSGAIPSQIGLVSAGMHCYGCDFVGWQVGYRAYGSQANGVFGGRAEVNGVGFQTGLDQSGAAVTANHVGLRNIEEEANDIGIEIAGTTTGVFENISISGTTNSYSATINGLCNCIPPTHKIRITAACTNCLFREIGVSGQASVASIQVNNAAHVITFDSVTNANSYATNPKVWDIQMPLTNIQFINTGFTPRPGDDTTNRYSYTRRSLIPSLTQIDNLNDNPGESKNLRGKNIAISAGAATKVITFPNGVSTGSTTITTATASAGAGTLAANTYFYRLTSVSEHGEIASAISNEKTVVVGGANNQVDLVTSNHGTTFNWKHRVYRGTATGVYGGYYEFTNQATTFTDIGAAFDGKKSPPSGDDFNMAESDSSYTVIPSVNFDHGGIWITGKGTTGFTMNFKNTAPGDGSGLADYVIVRRWRPWCGSPKREYIPREQLALAC